MMMSGTRLLPRAMYVLLCLCLVVLVDMESQSDICDLGSWMRPLWCVWAMLTPRGQTDHSSLCYHLKHDAILAWSATEDHICVPGIVVARICFDVHVTTKCIVDVC